MKIDVVNLDNQKTDQIELAEEVFGLNPRVDLLHRMIVWQCAKRRTGSHQTKTRGHIQGSQCKIWRQKGTGRARHGSRKTPQFRGGGVAFGPTFRSHATKLPRRVRRLALCNALSAMMSANRLTILDEAQLDSPKTKDFTVKVAKMNWSSVLIVDKADLDVNLVRASRNIPKIDLIPEGGINVYDILNHETLAMTCAALTTIEARLSP